MKIQDCLSSSDVEHLKDIKVTLKSNEGEFLSPVKKSVIERLTVRYGLVELNSDGSIPEDAVFSFAQLGAIRKSRLVGGLAGFYKTSYRLWVRHWAGISEFLWPSDEGDTQVEFRSPVPGFPPPGQLRVVCNNMKGYGRSKTKANYEYCLAADKDGTVKWLPESECVDGSHVWTVHLFEHRAGEVLYLRDQLQRAEPNIYNNCDFNYIGGNVNWSGTQTIGNVTTNRTNQLLGV